MVKVVRTALALVSLGLALSTPAVAACTTVTVCRSMGGGTWCCKNVPAREVPIEEWAE